MTRSFVVFFDMNNRLSKQSRWRWFETLSLLSLRRCCNGYLFPLGITSALVPCLMWVIGLSIKQGATLCLKSHTNLWKGNLLLVIRKSKESISIKQRLFHVLIFYYYRWSICVLSNLHMITPRHFLKERHPIVYWILLFHDDVIKWKHFPRYWPFLRESTGHRFFDLRLNNPVEQTIETPVILDAIALIVTSL